MRKTPSSPPRRTRHLTPRRLHLPPPQSSDLAHTRRSNFEKARRSLRTTEGKLEQIYWLLADAPEEVSPTVRTEVWQAWQVVNRLNGTLVLKRGRKPGVSVRRTAGQADDQTVTIAPA
jgi:hypothetical protein